MWKNWIAVLGCAGVVLFCPCVVMAAGEAPEAAVGAPVPAPVAAAAGEDQAPVAAAQAWLTMVDKGQYSQSWAETGAHFRTMVSQELWEAQLGAIRSQLGPLLSRELGAQKSLTTVPGGPDGEYCVMSFKTSFGNKAAATETVTVMKDKDGRWRLAGYFIK